MNLEPEIPPSGGLSRRSGWAPAPSSDRLGQASLLRFQLQRGISAWRRHWWVLLASLLVFGGPGIFYSAITPRTFRSQAVLWMGERLDLPEGRMRSEELSSYLGTQVELLKSALIKTRAIAKVSRQFPAAPAQEVVFDLGVRSALKSSTIEVTATGVSPRPTSAFVDAVIQEYLDYKSEFRKKTSLSALSTITGQIKDLERQISDKENVLSAFETSNNISVLTESGTSAGSHLARISGQLSDLRTEHHLLELLTPEQFKDMSQVPAGASTGISVPGQEAAQGLNSTSSAQEAAYFQALQQLELLKARRDDFAKVLRPTHSKMIKLNQDIAGFEQTLDTFKSQGTQQAAAQMANRKKSLELQIQNLEAQYGTWQTNAIEASRLLDQHERMKQELERYRGLYNHLLGLVQTVDLTKGLDQEALSPLAPASIAKPTLTKYKMGVAGVFAGVVVGLGLLWLLSLADDRFASAAELSLHLPAEVVGQVPEEGLVRNHRNGTGQQLQNSPAFVESFRNLRSHLLCMAGLADGPKIIMVTSAIPKEGKTTVTANLGTALALTGEPVLLVDADLRRSSLHRIFKLSARPGLSEVVGKAFPASKTIVPTTRPNLFLLPAGDGEDVGSEMFLTSKFDQLLQELSARFKYILIDTAPVLATDDAGTLGSRAQGALLIVRAGYTPARMIREALERLRARKVTLLGLIYNRAAPSSDYYSRYTRDYYAGTAAEPVGGELKQPARTKADSS
jgi:capsular exopolysaccharide synthesis family protein